MNIDSILKREGINVVKQLPVLQTNLIANNIALKLCTAFPEHQFNKQLLFSSLARLNMYIAKMPFGSSCAKYVSENNSIYFSEDSSLDHIDDLVIHECIHFLQETKDASGKLLRLGLADFKDKVSGIALNEAAVQLMASEANGNALDTVTYYNITFPTISPMYYPLQCALVNQMAYFTGTYPLYHSTLAGNSVFKNTFIAKSSKSTFNTVQQNLDKLVYLEDLVCQLANDLMEANSNVQKVASITKSIENKKKEIFNLFLKTQNKIMTDCFNFEFRTIRNMAELINFKSRIYEYKNIIATTTGYTFYNDFYNYTMTKFEQKQKYFEQHGFILLGDVKETALALIEPEHSHLAFIKKFFIKLLKLNQLKQEKLHKEEV